MAVALGVGSAVYGTSVAWADTSADGPSARESTSQSAGPRSSAEAARPAAHGGAKAVLAGRGSSTPTSAVRTQSTRNQPQPQPAATENASSVSDRAATLAALPVAAPAATLADADTEESPATSVEVVLASTQLVHPRRETAAPPAPAANALATPAAIPQAAAGENIALIMGGSGVPIPDEAYINAAFSLYVEPHAPVGTIPEQLVTPEGLYPITPYPYVKVLPLSVSVQQGNTILYDEVLQQLADDNTLTVFGYSQSAIISSLVMSEDNTDCTNASPCGLSPDMPVNFVLIGNEMNPNGGFLSRFPGLNLPSLGIPFYGPTPEDTFPVANYMREYDGFADFPQYPGNFLSSLNAAMGIGFVHPYYLSLTEEEVAAAIELPTSSDTQKYYVIPTEDLPLLTPIRAIPLIGGPIADLLQPALRVIVNLGYGDPKYGWSQGLANVETPFGVFPDVDWGETIGLFFEGVVQGVNDFIADITPGGSMWQELDSHIAGATSAMTALTALPSLTADGIIPTIQGVITGVTEFVSNAAASLYAALLPTADIINAIITVLPGYAINLFL
ncbi:MAG: PE-PPE domain-containing protein, partial [Mycobacterium sp.]|nr:PE-PPE domain-containing protein [Mycobacterium sp.]